MNTTFRVGAWVTEKPARYVEVWKDESYCKLYMGGELKITIKCDNDLNTISNLCYTALDIAQHPDKLGDWCRFYEISISEKGSI